MYQAQNLKPDYVRPCAFVWMCIYIYKKIIEAEMSALGSVQHPELRAANEILVRNLSSSAQRQSRIWQPRRTAPAPQALVLLVAVALVLVIAVARHVGAKRCSLQKAKKKYKSIAPQIIRRALIVNNKWLIISPAMVSSSSQTRSDLAYIAVKPH